MFDACFEGKLISSPVELICYMCVFLRCWSGLQREEDRQHMLEGAERLQEVTLASHEALRAGSAVLRIEEAKENEDEDVSTD